MSNDELNLRDEVIAEVVSEAIKSKTIEEMKVVFGAGFIQKLRANDRHFNKTCSKCVVRRPNSEMSEGKADVCDTCKKEK